MNEKPAAAIAAFIEDTLFLAEHGETPEAAAGRLGCPSAAALGKRLARYGAGPEVFAALRANEPPREDAPHEHGRFYVSRRREVAA